MRRKPRGNDTYDIVDHVLKSVEGILGPRVRGGHFDVRPVAWWW